MLKNESHVRVRIFFYSKISWMLLRNSVYVHISQLQMFWAIGVSASKKCPVLKSVSEGMILSEACSTPCLIFLRIINKYGSISFASIFNKFEKSLYTSATYFQNKKENWAACNSRRLLSTVASNKRRVYMASQLWKATSSSSLVALLQWAWNLTSIACFLPWLIELMP